MRPPRPLRPMSAVERFLERLLERPSARLFRTRVLPVQLELRVERAMEHGRRVELGRTIVPDRLTVRLPQAEFDALLDPTDLAVDLASHALSFARRRGFILSGRPQVAIQVGPSLRAGDIEVDGAFLTRPDPVLESALTDATRTRVYRRPIVQSARAVLEVVRPGRPRQTVPVGEVPMTIGRDPDNSLVLDDERVSRRHARLTARGSNLVITDLGSTNGIRVNGSRVQEIALGATDVIEIGETIMTVIAMEADGREPSSASDGTRGP
ncbi:MAG: FhaA domain-containing protein [Chloroflexota bacterium]